MDRRDFIKTASGGLALAAVSCGDKREADRIVSESGGLDQADLSWHKAPCRFCGTGCGVEVGVADGRVMSVRGDEASPVNRGLLCVKGYHTPELLYGEDRLTQPQLRRDYGDGVAPISWDLALVLFAVRYS
mgnify:CR=1 FL=1